MKENATKNDGKEASNNMLQIQPSVLELLLRSDKVPDQFSSQQLQEWIIQFDVFVKHPSVAGLDHQQKMKRFGVENRWTSDEGKNHNIRAAILNGWLISTGDSEALKNLIVKRRGKQSSFDWVYHYECPNCGSVDKRGITRRLSKPEYDKLPEDEALETPLGKKEMKKCPECREYVPFKRVRARTESWAREQQKRKTQRTRAKSPYDIWSMPLSPDQKKELDQIDSEDAWRVKIYQWLKEWLMQHPELLKEAQHLFAPNNRRESELKTLAKPIEKGGLGLKYPDQYPFRLHFLLVNLLVQIHEIRASIMDAIFQRASKAFMKRKRGPLSPKGMETLSNQAQSFLDVVKHLAAGGATKVENVEKYLSASLANSFRKAKRPPNVAKKLMKDEDTGTEKYVFFKRQILETDLGNHTDGPESEEEKITLETIRRQESSQFEDEMVLRTDLKSILASLPQRSRETVLLYGTGYTQKEISKKLGVSIKTIKRELQTLRSDPRLKELY